MSRKQPWRRRWPYLAQHFKRILALVLAGLLALVTIIAALFTAYAEEAPARDRYQMEIELLRNLGGAHVTAQITYTNRTGQPLTSAIFSIPANAYRRSMTVPFESDDLSGAYPAGFTPGGVDFFAVQVNGAPADWGLLNDAEDVLQIGCALAPGETAVFSFSYDLLLPEANGAFGATADTWYLSGFYPRAAVYDELLEQFTPLSLSPIGTSLYAEGADYAVTLYAPDGYDLGATGEATRETADPDGAKWTITGENLREFAFVLSRKVRAYSAISSGTDIQLLTASRAESGRTLDTARDVLDRYQDWFGAYPYGTLSIVETDALFTDSHPGLIAIPSALFSAGNRSERQWAIAYHIARQYFGLWAMNNPDSEPWLSDALCGYVALLYIETAEGVDAFSRRLNDYVLESLQITLPGSLFVDSEKARFSTDAEYDLIIRRRGAAAMHEIRKAVGADVFLDALRRYVDARGGRLASIADFAQALDDAAGREMDLYMMEMLRTIGEYTNQFLDYYE